MAETCPYRDQCTITTGSGGHLRVAAMSGYRCGFEIVGTVAHCPKYRRLAPVSVDAAGNDAPPRQLALQF